MDCRTVQFSPEKAKKRIDKALKTLEPKVLMRILAFSLYLLGASRRAIAGLVGLPQESVKTIVRVLIRDGLPAFRDRRRSNEPSPPPAKVLALARVSVQCNENSFVVHFGSETRDLIIPISNKVQMRTVLLSLLNSQLLSTEETASILQVTLAHCRELARKLERNDVVESLVDKRRGQTHDYRVGPMEKAELIQQFAARAVTGHSVSSEVLAEIVNERTQADLSPRTIRWHMSRLGLTGIKKTIRELVEALKKNSSSSD